MSLDVKVYVKLLSGDLLEIETRTDIPCDVFYGMVFDRLSEEMRPKGCRLCQMGLFTDTEEIVPYTGERMELIEGETFMLFLDKHRYVTLALNVDEVYEDGPEQVKVYHEIALSICQIREGMTEHGEERKEYIEHEESFYIWQNPAMIDGMGEQIRDGDGVLSEWLLNRRGGSDKWIFLPPFESFLSSEEMMDLFLNRAEQVMEISMSAKACIWSDMMEKYMYVANPRNRDEEDEEDEEDEDDNRD